MKLTKMLGLMGGGAFMSRLSLSAAAVLSAALCAAEPNTWYVDDDNYNESYADGAAYIAAGFDGTTTNKAFGTIQAAINASTTKAGDTIKVMPGTYDKGYYTESWSSGSINVRNRLYINKKLNIEAYGSKDETHIVGRWCPTDEGGDPTFHTGPTAVRCVRVPSGGRGSTLRGFTLRDSAAITGDSSAGGRMGGAISAGEYSSNTSYKDFYVIDCVISNSAAIRCGAAYGGTFIRCRIYNTLADKYGSALGKANAVNCVFTKCTNDQTVYGFFYGSGYMVNCTVFGSKSTAAISGTKIYNCVFTGNNTTAKNVETNGSYEAANIYTTTGKNYRNATPDQLFAPALGDFHPVAGSKTMTMGQTKYLTTSCPFTLPAELADEMFLDFEGTPIDTNRETVAAGAIQTPKTPKYGGILTTDGVNIDGTTTYGTTVFFADKWPMCVRATKTCHRLSVTGGSKLSGIHSRFMNKSGQTWLCPPYAAGSIKTNTYVEVKTNLYVDQVNGSDETGTGAEATPYATIQKAVDKATSTSSAYVIHVAEGDYDTGGAMGRGVTNRINLIGGRWIKFMATGDRDKTIIRGAAAKDERDPENHPGCGPDAVRCVSSSYNTAADEHSIAFVGFTFADGHTDVGQNADYDKCGAGFGRPNFYDALQFIDCVFTNCYAPAAGIASNASFTRCKFIDCGSGAEGFCSTYLASCEVGKGSFGTGVLGVSTHIVGTSIANDNAVASGAAPTLINSLLGDGGTVPSSVTRLWGSTANSCFADAANGDLRPVAGSPALDAAARVFPEPGSDDWGILAKYFADLSGPALDGKAWVFGGGFPIAGAHMEWVPGVSVIVDKSVDASIYDVSVASGGYPLAEGESLTASVERKADAVRHWGVVVNGYTNMLDNGAFSCAMPSSSELTGGAICISSVLDQNWYVNPDPESGASDENNGFTRDTAKLTLKGVLSVAKYSGDVVHAARGTYKQETMTYSSSYGDARAVIPSYVTLVADEGPEHTTIEGAAGTSGTYKQGEGAMRCVMLSANATVKGFTLINGHSSKTGSSDGGSATYNGGGAWANKEYYAARVVDCVISNCVAYSGGAAFGVALFGTKMVGNTGSYSVATKCSLYGCLVGANSYNSAGLYQCYDIFDTTLEAASKACVSLATYSLLRNSIVLGKVGGTTAPHNSIICGTYEAALAENAVDCVFTDKASLGLAGYVPAARGAACETGDETLLPANATNAKMLQEMRAARPIMNGGMDAGCCEADWRGCYAGDIAKRKITVTAASPNVVETEERNVRIYPGQSLEAAWNLNVGSQARYDMKFRVVGTGSLSVVANGVETTCDGEGEYTIKLNGALADASLSFAYSGEDGYAEILPWKSTSGIRIIIH